MESPLHRWSLMDTKKGYVAIMTFDYGLRPKSIQSPITLKQTCSRQAVVGWTHHPLVKIWQRPIKRCSSYSRFGFYIWTFHWSFVDTWYYFLASWIGCSKENRLFLPQFKFFWFFFNWDENNKIPDVRIRLCGNSEKKALMWGLHWIWQTRAYKRG